MLVKLKLKIPRDIQLKEYVKIEIFSNLEEIIFTKEEFWLKLKNTKIENCIKYSGSKSNRNITKFIIRNCNFFLIVNN